MNEANIEPAVSDQAASPQTASAGGENGGSLDGCAQEADTGALTYEPVPARRSVTVSVRYRSRGRGRPLPYTLPETGIE